MQQKIVFRSKGLNCSAIFYLPDNLSTKEKHPAMVMAHGIGSTKEMCLPQFAERFAAAGFAVLLFDYRNLGESEGIGSAARIETTCFLISFVRTNRRSGRIKEPKRPLVLLYLCMFQLTGDI